MSRRFLGGFPSGDRESRGGSPRAATRSEALRSVLPARTCRNEAPKRREEGDRTDQSEARSVQPVAGARCTQAERPVSGYGLTGHVPLVAVDGRFAASRPPQQRS